MKLRPTILAGEILEKQPLRKYFKRFLKLNLRWLSRFFGSRIYLELPENMQNLDPALYPAISAASELKDLGIVKHIRKKPKFSDEPFFHLYFTKILNDHCWGADFLSDEKAFWKCVAETAERHLWLASDFFYRQRVLYSTYKKLEGRALNIFSLAGFSAEQKERFEILKFDENTTLGWIPARSLTEKKDMCCPVQLLSARYFREKTKALKDSSKNEPMLRWSVSTGSAAGRSVEEAVVKGIMEVAERDAYMITYLNKLSPPEIDLGNLAEQDQDLAKILKSFRRYNLGVHLFQLPTDFPVSIILSALIDRTGVGPSLGMGARAGFNLKQNILDALAESLMIFSTQRLFLNKKIDSSAPLDRAGRILYWAKPEQLPKIEFLLKGKKMNVDLPKEQSFYKLQDDDASRRKYYKTKLDFLANDLKRKKYEACYVELTTPEIKKIGLRCVRVVIPELQPLHLDESIPCFGGKRLKEVPLKLGYKPAEELNKEPHPFP